MLYATLKVLHVLAIVVWVGGMVFVPAFLRPALADWDGPQRLRLLHAVLGRFFAAVAVAAGVALVTGLWMIGSVQQQVAATGGRLQMPLSWTLMAVLGVLMIAIFGHIRVVLYRRLTRALAGGALPAAAEAMASIRRWVTVNLVLGLAIIVVATAGGA